MLDFELKMFHQLRDQIAADPSSLSIDPSSLSILWDRAVRLPIFGAPLVCIPGYAGHTIRVRENRLSTAVYIDFSNRPTGEKLLSADEIKELTYAVEEWNTDDDRVEWAGEERACRYRLFPANKLSYEWPEAASIPASVANLATILNRLAATVAPVSAP